MDDARIQWKKFGFAGNRTCAGCGKITYCRGPAYDKQRCFECFQGSVIARAAHQEVKRLKREKKRIRSNATRPA